MMKVGGIVRCLAVVALGATAWAARAQIAHAPEPITGPFSLYQGFVDEAAAQLSVCCIVELVGKAEYVTQPTELGPVDKAQRRMLKFDVKALTGAGVELGKTYHCLCNADRNLMIAAIPGHPKRYLLLGWPSGNSGRLPIDYKDVFRRSARLENTETVSGGPDTLFATALLPTRQDGIVSSGNVLQRAYLNLADVVLRGAEPATVRQVTNHLANLCSSRPPSLGLSVYNWVRATIGPKFARAKLTAPVERLRIGGLLATWDRPKYAMAFWKALPGLMKELDALEPEPERRPMTERYSPRELDTFFIRSLDLFTGLDPDEVLAVTKQCPMLGDLILDPRLGKPSLDNQQLVLKYLDDPEPETRAQAFRQLAGWYCEGDKVADAHWSNEVNGVVIDNEPALRSYWLKKIGPPVRP